ncbi:hypothetical protein H7F50_17820 [Novosphingobium flavum]|uniref:Uncharacterized protein n=1 Tax=Novosphingobium aerophilum TaxID=2839843 RepID=A0A7X1KDN4_9SPHN|nr:hypothetical protein [Novosphingobium aerophilum]MBC2653347.1 hypothetical protein [Novosphingobium aerophilum]MBC2663601.1 hypothetical protein [Novosphingobium aerophilum]
MTKGYVLILAFLFSALPTTVAAQTTTTAPPVNPPPATAEPTPPLSNVVVIRRDTPVELMAYSEVSTAKAQPGTRFRLMLNQPITVAGTVVVPKGAWAFGEVLSAEESGGLGHSGRMSARLLYLKAGDAEIPLDGQTSAKGTGAGSAGVAVIFTGIVGLFHRGNNAKIKAGEIVAGFVAEDVALDLAATPIRRVPGGAVR